MAKSTTTRKTAASRAAAVADQAERHAPVSLPSGGSYDAQALQKSLDKAVDGNAANRDTEVSSAIAGASLDRGTVTNAPNSLPDHKIARAEVMIGQATEKDGKMVAGETVTEFRQVYDPASAGEQVETEDVVLDKGLAIEDGTSTVLSLETVEPAKASKSPTAPLDSGDPGQPHPDAVEESIADGLATAAGADATAGQ